MSVTDILVGIHGSGLVNGIFMPELSTVLEIIPVQMPKYGSHKGTIMRWIFDRVPQRIGYFPLLPYEQKHEKLRDWQKPFNIKWERLKVFLDYLMITPNDYCPHKIPNELARMNFSIGIRKRFSKRSPLFDKKPKCGNIQSLTW